MASYVTTDNVVLYYEERGQGQPMVFVHGWSGSGKTMRPVMDFCKDTYRCISYDHRGHGASGYADKGLTIAQLGRDLRELILYLDLQDVILVAHSMGAATAYSYIEQFGCDRLANAIFVDMSPKLLNDAEWKFGFGSGDYTMSSLSADMEKMNTSFPLFMFDFLKKMLPSMAAMPPYLAEMIGPSLVGDNHPLILKGLWFSMFIADFRAVFEKLTVPALYFYPEKGLYPIEAAEYIRDQAHSTINIIKLPECSHRAMEEVPERIAAEIKSFLD